MSRHAIHQPPEPVPVRVVEKPPRSTTDVMLLLLLAGTVGWPLAAVVLGLIIITIPLAVVMFVAWPFVAAAAIAANVVYFVAIGGKRLANPPSDVAKRANRDADASPYRDWVRVPMPSARNQRQEIPGETATGYEGWLRSTGRAPKDEETP